MLKNLPNPTREDIERRETANGKKDMAVDDDEDGDAEDGKPRRAETEDDLDRESRFYGRKECIKLYPRLTQRAHRAHHGRARQRESRRPVQVQGGRAAGRQRDLRDRDESLQVESQPHVQRLPVALQKPQRQVPGQLRRIW